MTQSDEILAHLKAGNKITASYAMNHFRCYRLAARICDLRNDGHTILTRTVKRKSKRTGRILSFAEYSYGDNK